jgi:O-antigen ligase
MKQLQMRHAAGRSTPRIDRQSFLVLFIVLGLTAMAIVAGELFGPLAAVATPFAIALLVAALRDYRLSTWLTIFILPIGPTNVISRDMLGLSPIYLVYAMLMVTFSSLLLTSALHPGRLVFPSWPRMFWLYLALFVGASIHGAFYIESIPDYFVALNVVTSNSVRDYLLVTLINPSLALAVAFVVSIAIRSARRPAMYLIPVFASAMLYAFVVFYFAITSGGSLNDLASQESRAYLSGTGMHANELGLLLNTALALALFSFSNVRRFALRVSLGIVVAIFALAVLLTFSRGSWLGTLAVIGYLLYVRRNFALFAVALLVLPIAVMLMPASVAERATHEMGGNDVDALSSGRVDEIWKPLLPEVLKNPLLGGGTASVMWSEPARQQSMLPVGHPHSAYLGALLDLGVIGAAVILLFFRHMWRLFRRVAAHVGDRLWQGVFHGAAACILLMFVQGMTDDSFLPSRTQPYVWISYGAALGFASRMKARARAVPAMAPAMAPAIAPPVVGFKARPQ